MSLVRSPSHVTVGGADELPHYTGSLEIPQSLQQPSPAPQAPDTPPDSPSNESSQWRTVLCPDASVAGHGVDTGNLAMSSTISSLVFPHESQANGSMTPDPMCVSHNWQGMQKSPTPPFLIGTPINAASSFWWTQVCPNAPLRRHSIGQITPINKWPSNISTPMIVSSPLSRGPDPDALRFAISGAKLDLAGASTLAKEFDNDAEVFGQNPDEDTSRCPVSKETNTVTAEAVAGRKPKGQLRKRHTESARSASDLPRVQECSDRTSPDSVEPSSVTEYESPEKHAAPVRFRARDAQKSGKKDKARFITN